MVKQVLVIGANGTLGRAFRNHWIHNENVEVTYAVRRKEENTSTDIQFDLTDFSTVISMAEALIKYDVVINCAAITQVDDIENNEEVRLLSAQVNWRSVEMLAKACKRINATLIHFSTDYVFDGEFSRPYCEDDTTSTNVNTYGFHKWCAENAITESGCKYLIFRVSWLYSETPGNFFSGIFTKMQNGETQFLGTTDIIASPTYAKDVVTHICMILLTKQENKIGIYHYTNEGVCTRYDFMQAMREYSDSTTPIYIDGVDNSKFETAAVRPYCTVLSKTKFKTMFGFYIRSWKDALADCCEEFKKLNDKHLEK
jgi:dTDP-4-dehydrorhamnose reductase